MQKEIIIVSVILVIMFVLNGVTTAYTTKEIDSVGSGLEDVATLAMEELDKQKKEEEAGSRNPEGDSGNENEGESDTEADGNSKKAKEKISQINDDWDMANKKLAYYIEHDELEKISTSMVTIKEYINLENYEEAVPEIKKCVFILEHLEEKGTFSIVNLF